MTDAAITAICSSVGLGITFLVTELFKYKRELMLREQTRLDRITDQAAIAHVAEVAKAGLERGEERKDELMNKIQQVQTVAIAGVRQAQKAYTEANGINTKLARDGVKLIIDEHVIQQVEVINTPEHPIPTEAVTAKNYKKSTSE